MQPKEKLKYVKVGKETIVAGVADGSPKTHPVEQWDQVAFKLIQDILAPKGYKEVTSGRWRGLKIANAEQPGIVKSKVNQAQKVAAQMVRTFRGKAIKQLADRAKNAEERSSKASIALNGCHFWQFKKRREFAKEYRHYRDQIGLIEIIANELNNISIK